MLIKFEIQKRNYFEIINTESEVWDFIQNAEKIKFPQEVQAEYELVAEYVVDWTQYRLYITNSGDMKYAKINLKQEKNDIQRWNKK